MAEPSKESWLAHWRCFAACGIMVLSPFQYGVDFGLIGGLQAMQGFLEIYGYKAPKTVIGWNITTVRQQLISSLMTLGAFLSSGFAGFAAVKLGRRACLWMACLLCVVSNIIMMTTTHIGALYVGRLLIGLANGYFMTFSQLYIQESSPAKYRGLFLSGFQFCTSFGSLIGTIVDWRTAKMHGKTAYLIPLGVIYIVPLFLTVGMLFIPESPRWLILQGRFEDGVKSLEWLRPEGADVRFEAQQIHEAIEKEKEMGRGINLIDTVKDPIDRRRTILAVCSVTLQAASGSMFIIAYKAYFLTMSKVPNAFGMSCVLSALGLLALIINTCIIVRYGRRRVLLMMGLTFCGVMQLIIAITYHKKPGASSTGKVLVALSCLYMMSYNGMIAAYAWLCGGELPSQRLRSYTFGLASAVGFFFAWLTTFTAPYFINPASLDWGPRYGFIWFPSCIIAASWVYFFLPEVKGRTLEEIDEMFQAKLPARKFRRYQCTQQLDTSETKLARRSTEENVWGNEKAVAETTVTTGQ